MDDLIQEFLTETAESLSTLDVEIVKLEQNPNDVDVLGNIFRLMHTIKGTCGFLGLPRLEKVAHAGEDVLGKFRDGELDITPSAISSILACVDRIREIVAALEATGEEPAGDDSPLIEQLHAAAAGTVEAANHPEPGPAEVSADGPVMSDDGFPMAAELVTEVEAALAQDENASDQPASTESGPEQPADTGLVEDAPPAPEAGGNQTPRKAQASEHPGEPAQKEPTLAAQSIRVNVDVLETLMTMVSELVLTRNNLLQMIRGQDDSEFVEPLQRLSLITTDLQEGVMKMRMQPIGNAWAKLPRIVRDLALETGKQLDLKMLGAETELDRQALELIKDPLTHMVRNSADHGIETPDERAAAGKPATGTITLNAYHQGGHIIIAITDDGKGLSSDRIRQKAVQNGLATDAELDGMSDQQIQQFIFKPGFSTAEQVTSVSGRGVGMDVVRSNVEKIGGTIELKSVAGEGSTFTIKIPLTLAIVSALIVQCGDEKFAIPQISVTELVRVSPKDDTVVDMINKAPVLRLRDRLLPLVSLREILKLGTDGDGTDGEYFVVVTQVGAHDFGIVVDQVFDTEEIVVKPVARMLRSIPYYSGNTILGDGSVIMILDPNGIASSVGQHAVSTPEEASTDTGHQTETTALIVFRAGGAELKAVPMELVARLEEIDLRDVEHVNGRHVVQYRGHFMPLVGPGTAQDWGTEGNKPVLVFTDRERSAGMVVDEIVDIVDEELSIEIPAMHPGILGSGIVSGRATDLIDASHFLSEAFDDFFVPGQTGLPRDRQQPVHRILLVDDSIRFRNLIAPRLSALGFHVVAATCADQAKRIQESGAAFDLIISDGEVPGLEGCENIVTKSKPDEVISLIRKSLSDWREAA